MTRRVAAIIKLDVLPPIAPDMLARASNVPAVPPGSPPGPPPPLTIATADVDQDAVDACAWAWLEQFYVRARKRNPFSRRPVKAALEDDA